MTSYKMWPVHAVKSSGDAAERLTARYAPSGLATVITDKHGRVNFYRDKLPNYPVIIVENLTSSVRLSIYIF